MEAFRDIFTAVVQEQAQGDWDIEVDSQNVGLDGSAKANSGFKISETLDERAARGLWWGTNDEVNQVIQYVGTYT